jgi:hypothetical protein
MVERLRGEGGADFGVSEHDAEFERIEIARICSASRSEVRGVSSDGLSSARLPAANTPASGPNERLIGKFQGLMMPTTPSGWYSTRACTPGIPASCASGRIQCSSCSRAWRMLLMGASTSVASV